jgi:hypothetical protein
LVFWTKKNLATLLKKASVDGCAPRFYTAAACDAIYTIGLVWKLGMMKSSETLAQGCQIFLGPNIPKWEKYTKRPLTRPNDQKLYQMAVNYSKWS